MRERTDVLGGRGWCGTNVCGAREEAGSGQACGRTAALGTLLNVVLEEPTAPRGAVPLA